MTFKCVMFSFHLTICLVSCNMIKCKVCNRLFIDEKALLMHQLLNRYGCGRYKNETDPQKSTAESSIHSFQNVSLFQSLNSRKRNHHDSAKVQSDSCVIPNKIFVLDNVGVTGNLKNDLVENDFLSEVDDSSSCDDDECKSECESTSTERDTLNDEKNPVFDVLENPFDDAMTKNVSPNVKAYIKLILLLNQWGCPEYSFNQILKWLEESLLDGFQTGIKHPEKRKVIQDLQNDLSVPNPIMSSVEVKVPALASGVNVTDSVLEVISFDFKSELMELLNNTELMQKENLVHNSVDPFSSCDNTDETLIGEIHTGKSYQNAVESLITNVDREFLVPIIMFIDATHIDGRGKLNLEPIVFSTSLFKRHIRNRPCSWRHLGFIPN